MHFAPPAEGKADQSWAGRPEVEAWEGARARAAVKSKACRRASLTATWDVGRGCSDARAPGVRGSKPQGHRRRHTMGAGGAEDDARRECGPSVTGGAVRRGAARWRRLLARDVAGCRPAPSGPTLRGSRPSGCTLRLAAACGRRGHPSGPPSTLGPRLGLPAAVTPKLGRPEKGRNSKPGQLGQQRLATNFEIRFVMKGTLALQ